MFAGFINFVYVSILVPIAYWYQDFCLGVKQFFCWHNYEWKTDGGFGIAYGYEVCSKCKKVRV